MNDLLLEVLQDAYIIITQLWDLYEENNNHLTGLLWGFYNVFHHSVLITKYNNKIYLSVSNKPIFFLNTLIEKIYIHIQISVILVSRSCWCHLPIIFLYFMFRGVQKPEST